MYQTWIWQSTKDAVEAMRVGKLGCHCSRPTEAIVWIVCFGLEARGFRSHICVDRCCVREWISIDGNVLLPSSVPVGVRRGSKYLDEPVPSTGSDDALFFGVPANCHHQTLVGGESPLERVGLAYVPHLAIAADAKRCQHAVRAAWRETLAGMRGVGTCTVPLSKAAPK